MKMNGYAPGMHLKGRIAINFICMNNIKNSFCTMQTVFSADSWDKHKRVTDGIL